MFDASDHFAEIYRLDAEFERLRERARKKKGPVEMLLGDLEQPEPEAGPVTVGRYFLIKRESKKFRVDQLRNEIESRRGLHKAFVSELNRQIRYAKSSLEKFRSWGVGYNTGVDVKRNHLERLLQQLRGDRRSAQLKTWDDLIRLRKELREATTEYGKSAQWSGGT